MASMPVRQGTVSSIDYENGMVSVTYPDRDGDTTVKLPYFSFTGEYRMPDVGDEVIVLHRQDGQAAGFILGQFFNKAHPPVEGREALWRKELGDGAYMRYDDRTGELLICANHVRFVCSDDLVVETKRVQVDASDSVEIATTTMLTDAQTVRTTADQYTIDAQRITFTSTQLTADSSTIAANASQITADAGSAVIRAATTIDGTLSVSNNMSVAGTITANGSITTSGSVSASGAVTAGGNVTGAGVSLSGHTHDAPEGPTSPPR